MRRFVFSASGVFFFSLLAFVCCGEVIYTNVPNCRANRMLFPICASNGKNYANRDLFECANRAAEGQLTIKTEGKPCSDDDAESASARSLGLVDENDFTDVEDCRAPKIYNPLCASNGKSYVNEVVFNCEKDKDDSLTIEHLGHCKEEMKVDRSFTFVENCRTSMIFNPMCASNGKSYINEVLFQCANEAEEGKLEIVSDGYCNDIMPSQMTDDTSAIMMELTIFTPFSECIANKMYAPVCGSDKKTYANRDMFECANRKAEGTMFIVGNFACEIKSSKTPESRSNTGMLTNRNYSFIVVFGLLVLFLQ